MGSPVTRALFIDTEGLAHCSLELRDVRSARVHAQQQAR